MTDREHKTINNSSFAAICVEIQEHVRDGWFIVNVPINYISIYEVNFERNLDSMRHVKMNIEKRLGGSDRLPVAERMAKARAAKGTKTTEGDTDE